MGAFLVSLRDHERGVELSRFAAPNVLAYEAAEHAYRQIFPPHDTALDFEIGVCGVTESFPEERPDNFAGASFGPDLTFALCTGVGAGEGGCYTDTMRDSFGYQRRPVTFTAALKADGGMFDSSEATFPNQHSWSPQAASAWDLPWTEDIEQPPPEWTPKRSWEPELGYPWQRPRKRCFEQCEPGEPDNCRRSYMYTWDQTGALDWLCDFRRMGGFPITMAFLSDASRSKLVAAAKFRAPVLLRPGTTLFVRYRARISAPRLTRDFALRFAQRAFANADSAFDAILCRPVLATAPPPGRRTTFADLEPHFHPGFGPYPLLNWTFVAGPPPYIHSEPPQWTNNTGNAAGPFAWLAVYGVAGAVTELMWAAPIEPAVSVPVLDTLRVPDGVRFQLDGE